MVMSKDRIEFTAYAPDRDKRQTADAMVKAFGISHHRAITAIERGERILCRPSQFGRFIVFRYKSGIPVNNICHLAPEIIEAKEIHLDVTGNPARHASGEGA